MLIACVNSYLLSFPVKLGEAREELTRHGDAWITRSDVHSCMQMGAGKKRIEKTLERYIRLKSTRRQNCVLYNPQAVSLKIRLQ